jgi:hypothetical protein
MFQNKNFNTPGGNSIGANMGKISKEFINNNNRMENKLDNLKTNNNLNNSLNNNLNNSGNNSAGNNNFLNPNNMKRG